MPFTPFHMGPGLVMKALLQGSFSLMVFGWTQIVMDLQPLFVLLTGEGHLHGFSHTYVGATLLAIFSAISGKYLSELGLYLLRMNPNWQVKILWHIAFISAFIGSFSHVALDSLMHSDMRPLFPFSEHNALLGLITYDQVHQLCLASAIIGAVIYLLVNRFIHKKAWNEL